MFKEEWAKRRPALANLSIWTLVSYARKFDSLKKQLIQDHNQVFRGGDRRRKGFVEPETTLSVTQTIPNEQQQRSGIIYFNQSSIPKVFYWSQSQYFVKSIYSPRFLKSAFWLC